LGLVQVSESPPHILAVKQIIARCQKEEKQLTYTGSWTINPDIRKNRPLTKEINRLFHTIYVLFHVENKIDEIITGGTVRFKADVMVQKMGHAPLSDEQGALPPIAVKHLFDEKVLVTHLRQFSSSALLDAELYRKAWDQRIEISYESISKRTRLRLAG